jgi:hypothetical protein
MPIGIGITFMQHDCEQDGQPPLQLHPELQLLYCASSMAVNSSFSTSPCGAATAHTKNNANKMSDRKKQKIKKLVQ